LLLLLLWNRTAILDTFSPSTEQCSPLMCGVGISHLLCDV